MMTTPVPEVFRFSRRLTVVPVLHGSGDVAVAVRRFLLEHRFDCIAVPLPPSFQEDVERAIEHLPAVSMVTQEAAPRWGREWSPDSADSERDEQIEHDERRELSFVPIDPCQAVIAALRFAISERKPRAFIDLETDRFESYTTSFPDPYALKRAPLEKFAATLLAAAPTLPEGQPRDRVAAMAARLRELEKRYERVVAFVCLLDWPWIREAYAGAFACPEDEPTAPTAILQPEIMNLLFVLGELPYVTELYESARRRLEDDETLSVDGVKEILIEARDRYVEACGDLARTISPQLLGTYLKYVRNLALLERRLTPDLYTLVVAARQIAGDRFALELAEVAREYGLWKKLPFPPVRLGIGRARLSDGETVSIVSRLPGAPLIWRSCDLRRKPEPRRQRDWMRRWNPFFGCSWPPEDEVVERFRARCVDRARELMTADFARSEKFTTSVEDGIDMRETLRNWHTGDVYVKKLPPAVGGVDCVLMLFDSPADPRQYPSRITWYAEHDEESTLAFYATSPSRNFVGPGITRGKYGGCLFLYPPVHVPDIWRDRRLEFATTLEERLLAAACLHSRNRHIVLVSSAPPGSAWRRLARRCRKRWVHLPLARFSQETIESLRVFHVLNGRHVRSYASRFIRGR